ncbi:hypothetical protein HK101_003129 [Irineochytrium annulatum]|nr:hypothetical protein HK101_003129 [Irineochytrium annulatum]
MSKELRLLNFVLKNATAGSPGSVIAALDRFGYEEAAHMSVGDAKGPIVAGFIEKHKPQVMAELGGYCGYSAVFFSRLLPAGARYVSFEYSAEYAAIATKIIAHAGLADRVSILVGAFSETYPRLESELGIKQVDMFFIDHAKERYLPDFRIIEQKRLCKSGGVVIADNVIYPGAPDYLKYVAQAESVASHQVIESELEFSRGQVKDALSVSIMK